MPAGNTPAPKRKAAQQGQSQCERPAKKQKEKMPTSDDEDCRLLSPPIAPAPTTAPEPTVEPPTTVATAPTITLARTKTKKVKAPPKPKLGRPRKNAPKSPSPSCEEEDVEAEAETEASKGKVGMMRNRQTFLELVSAQMDRVVIVSEHHNERFDKMIEFHDKMLRVEPKAYMENQIARFLSCCDKPEAEEMVDVIGAVMASDGKLMDELAHGADNDIQVEEQGARIDVGEGTTLVEEVQAEEPLFARGDD